MKSFQKLRKSLLKRLKAPLLFCSLLLGGQNIGYAEGLHKPVMPTPSHIHRPNIIKNTRSNDIQRRIVLKKDACLLLPKSIWMSAIRSEAMLTAITCHRQDAYNAILSRPQIKRKFRSVSVASLFAHRSSDSSAELANIQSLYDLRTYGEGMCASRLHIITDMETLTPDTAYEYIRKNDISIGDKCKPIS